MVAKSTIYICKLTYLEWCQHGVEVEVDHMFTLPLHLLQEGRLLFFHHTNLGKIPIFLSKNPPQHIELETTTMVPPDLHNTI
jgi:hypothetical protein